MSNKGNRWPVIGNITKILTSVILIMGPTIYFGYKSDSVVMGLSILAGAIASAFINLDKFEAFKGAGFEAVLKEKIQEADLTIQQMRQLMKPVLISALYQITFLGRMGRDEERLNNLHEDIVKVSKKLKLNDDSDVSKQILTHYRLIACDLYRQIYAPNSRICENVSGFKDEFKKIFNPLSDKPCPTANQIEKIFTQNNTVPTPQQEEAINNYSKFISQHPGL